MKTTMLLAAAVLIAALTACTTTAQSPGQELNGFWVDEKCADYYAQSPVYGGNRALAYAANCSSVGM
ncbi:MAG TPA: hypothetical protein VFB01_07480 [Burkholderiales bacterium]|nr:hypothetical protein [Burkholderiales bacterium]